LKSLVDSPRAIFWVLVLLGLTELGLSVEVLGILRTSEAPWIHHLQIGSVAIAVALVAMLYIRRKRESNTDLTAELQNLIDTFPASTALLDLNLNILSVNRTWAYEARQNGVPEDYDWVGRAYLQPPAGVETACCETEREVAETDPESWEEFAQEMRALRKGKVRSVASDYPCARPQSMQWYRQFAEVFEYSGRQYILASHIDITAEVEAKSEHREAAALAQSMIDNAPYAVTLRDADGRYLIVNRRFEETFGVERASVIGRLPVDVLPPDAAAFTHWHDEETRASGSPNIYPGAEFKISGEKRRFTVTKFSTPHPSGDIRALATISVETTDRDQDREFLGTVVRNSPSAIIAINDENRITAVNAAFLKILGWREADVLGLGLDDLVDAVDHLVAPTQLFREKDQTQSGQTFRNRFLHQDGSYRWLEWFFLGFWEGQLHLIARDVDMEILDLEGRDAREERLERIIMQAPTPIMLHDSDGNVVLINDRWTKVSGYTRDDIPTLGDWAHRAYPENEAKELERIPRLNGLTETVHEGIFSPRMKSGEIREWDFQSTPLGTDSEGRSLVLSMAVDVTETQQMTRKLEESDRRWRAMAETAADAIINIDDRGAIISANAAATRIFGYSAAEMLGNNVSLLMPESIAKRHDGYLKSYRHTGQEGLLLAPRELTGKHRDGHEFPIDIAIGKWTEGDKVYFTGIIRDMTQRKAMREQLHQSQKMETVGKLTGGIAHDFNNFLTVIRGNLELLQEGRLSKKARDRASRAVRAATLAGNLTERLLLFSRRQPLKPVLVDISDAVESMDSMIESVLTGAINIEGASKNSLFFRGRLESA